MTNSNTILHPQSYRKPNFAVVPSALPKIQKAISELRKLGEHKICKGMVNTAKTTILRAASALDTIDPDMFEAPWNVPGLLDGPERIAREECRFLRLTFTRSMGPVPQMDKATLDYLPVSIALLKDAAESVAHRSKIPNVQHPDNCVLVAKVAEVAGMRACVLLKRLRVRKYHIFGPEGSFEVELSQAIAALEPKKRKQVKKWAESGCQ